MGALDILFIIIIIIQCHHCGAIAVLSVFCTHFAHSADVLLLEHDTLSVDLLLLAQDTRCHVSLTVELLLLQHGTLRVELLFLKHDTLSDALSLHEHRIVMTLSLLTYCSSNMTPSCLTVDLLLL